MDIYVVEPGDTLLSIAQRNGISAELLALENGLSPEDSLLIGQALLIARPELSYTVQPGDSLNGIAESQGVSLRQLWRYNPWLSAGYSIYPGQSVILQYQESGSPVSDSPVSERREFFVNGYAYPYLSREILGQALACLNTLSLFAYGFTEQGALVRPNSSQLADWARAAQVGTMMVLAPLDENGQFNNEQISRVLNDPAKRQRLIQEIMAELSAEALAGVDLDFEYIKKEDSQSYIDFAAALQKELSSRGMRLTVALAPKLYAEQPGLLYEGHDYGALGAIADHVTLMTYEWGYTYGPPMAVSPLPQVRRVAEYGVSEIEPRKILLGMSNYGYDWTLPYEQGRPARSIGNQQALDIARRYGAEIVFDEYSQVPYFSYRNEEGVEHVVWFEDVRSISARMALAADLGLGGLSYWTVMRPFMQNWLYLALAYTITP